MENEKSKIELISITIDQGTVLFILSINGKTTRVMAEHNEDHAKTFAECQALIEEKKDRYLELEGIPILHAKSESP